MITLPKIVALFFGLIVISKTFIDFRHKQENWQMFLFWLILWAGIIYVAFDPLIISQIIIRLGDKNFTVGQIVGVGFVFTLFVVYRVYVKAHRLEKQLNIIIRKIALLELKRQKNK